MSLSRGTKKGYILALRDEPPNMYIINISCTFRTISIICFLPENLAPSQADFWQEIAPCLDLDLLEPFRLTKALVDIWCRC